MTKPGRVIVREATSVDYEAWLRLWRAYQTFYEVDLPIGTTATTWARLLDPEEPMHAALAEDDTGAIVGLVHFIEHRSCWAPQNSFYLQDLFTAAEARSAGVGRALIEHVYARASKVGVGKVHWLTHETNQQAMRLYDQVGEKSGFVQYRKTI
jgi:GNAT superfamily N-acetyltransferase